MEREIALQESSGLSFYLNEQRVYLGKNGALAYKESGFHRPMYLDLSEVLEIIQIALEEKLQQKIEYFRTVESGAVEEYVVIRKEGGRKNLLFRAWPVFYTHNRRLEYIVYEEGQKLSHLISYYLDIFARTNNASLVLKK